MPRLLPLVVLALAVVGCGGSAAAPTATPTPSPTVGATATPAPRPTTTPRPKPTATQVIVIDKRYAAFVRGICAAFRDRGTRTLADALPYYQYNSGLRYGFLGDGEGQTADPSLLGVWLAGAHVRCAFFTPGVAGHGLVLTGGWHLRGGPWSLVELDTFNGRWKINDFTFGRFGSLYEAMQVARPVLRYRG